MFLATQTKEADCISVEISNTSLDTLIFPYIGDTCLFYDEDNAIRIDFAEYIEQHCEMIYEIHPPIAALNEFLIPNKLHGNYLIRFVIIPPHQKSRFYFKGYLKKNHS
ncbi:MAG: hypothetical protein L6Q29_05375, partial [Candidatus Pacebacteria bacterium]|nr:hypothetical protein [Candidatus Paceibacterota bacterium]